MPRYKEKFKEEMAFFINPQSGYVTYNHKCKTCTQDCKQSFQAEIICCHFYEKVKINSINQGGNENAELDRK